jgi:hypothetical protein
MARPIWCLVVALGLALPLAAHPAQPGSADPEVVKGVRLVEDGDYDGAILTLDNAARRLAADPSKAKDLSQAYLYLGIAYVGKGHEAAAKAKFREALAQIKDLSLSPDKFPPKVIDVFEAARQEEARAPKPVASKKKGGGGKVILIGAGVVAAGAGVAVAAGGGGGGSKTPADNRTVDNFAGSLCGSSYEGAGGCQAYRTYDIVVSGPGTLEAMATWSDGSIFFEMLLQDGNFADVARSNRTTNTSSQLTSSVTPQTSCSGCSYHVYIQRGDDGPAAPFMLTIKHP